MENSRAEQATPIYKLLNVQTISLQDLRIAVFAGIRDFANNPLQSAVFGLLFVIGGYIILAALFYFDLPWMIVPIAVGFPLIGPFVGACLYEMSRQHQNIEQISLTNAVKSVFKKKELGWMAFVVLFVFWIWIYQVRILLAIFLGYSSLSSNGQFLKL